MTAQSSSLTENPEKKSDGFKTLFYVLGGTALVFIALALTFWELPNDFKPNKYHFISVALICIYGLIIELGVWLGWKKAIPLARERKIASALVFLLGALIILSIVIMWATPILWKLLTNIPK